MGTGDAMIHAMVRMDLEPARHTEALDILYSYAGRVRTKPGCMGCYVYQDTENKRAVMLAEFWNDEEKMQHHLRSRDYQNILFVMEMARSVPDVSFNAIERSTGVETIEAARLGHPADMNGRGTGASRKNG